MAGTDQTILNFMLHKEKIDMMDIYQFVIIFRIYIEKILIVIDKEMQHWMDDKLYFLDVRLGLSLSIPYHQIHMNRDS